MADSSFDMAFAQTAAGVAGSVAQAAMGAGESKKQREWQEKIYEWQKNDARENWRMQNEYNSPTAQMERLKEAGLNPHLVYGSGASGASGSSSGSPQLHSAGNYTPYQYPHNMFAGFGEIASLIAGLRKTEAETSSIETHQALTEQQAITEGIKQISMNLANSKTSEEAKVWKQMMEFRLGLAENQMKAEAKRIGLIGAQKDNFDSKTAYQDMYNDNYGAFGRQIMQNEGEASFIKNSNMRLQGQNLISDLLTKQYVRANIQQQISESLSRVGVNNKQISKITQEILNLKANEQGYVYENQIKEILIKNGVDLKHLHDNGGLNLNSFIFGINSFLYPLGLNFL